MKTLLIVLLIIVALALVGLAVVLLSTKEYFPRIKEWIRLLLEKIINKITPKEIQHDEAPRKEYSQQATTQQKSPEPIICSAGEDLNEEKAREQFVLKQEKFFGIYENLYLVAKAGEESPQCNLEDWNTRIQSLSDAPDLKAYWEVARSHPAEFLDFVYACGVVRDERKTIKATEQTRYGYFMLDGTPIETGRTYKVMQPCWTSGDVILEKGIINTI